LLGGWSLGATIAYEMAQQLTASGNRVGLLALIDGAPRTRQASLAEFVGDQPVDDALLMATALGQELGLTVDHLRQLDNEQQLEVFLERAKAANLFPPFFAVAELRRMIPIYKANFLAAYKYQPVPYPGR